MIHKSRNVIYRKVDGMIHSCQGQMISFTSHRVAQITRMYIFAILELAAKIAAGSRMCGCQASQVNLHARKVPCIQRQLIKCVKLVLK